MNRKILKEWYPYLDEPEKIQARNSDVINTSRAISGLSAENFWILHGLKKNRYYICSSREPSETERNPILSALNVLSRFAEINNMTLAQYVLTITGAWDASRKSTDKPKIKNPILR